MHAIPHCSSRLSAPVPWRLRIDGTLSGEENMRADEELLEEQKRPGAVPVLRFFRWKRPTLSYGRLQDPKQAEQKAKLFQVEEVVRRPTGGGVVRHDKDLSLSLVWRRDHPGFPKCLKDIYRGIHETVQAALRKKGMETSLYVPVGRTPGEGICFAEPVEDDLMWEGRKILGGALRVTGWGRLYQGNLLTDSWEPGRTIDELRKAFELNFFHRASEPEQILQ